MKTVMGMAICGYCGKEVRSDKAHFCEEMGNSIDFGKLSGLKIKSAKKIKDEFNKQKNTRATTNRRK